MLFHYSLNDAVAANVLGVLGLFTSQFSLSRLFCLLHLSVIVVAAHLYRISAIKVYYININ